MDRTEVLNQLDRELQEIIDNHEESLARVRNAVKEHFADGEQIDPQLQLYFRYAIMVYGLALLYIRSLRELHNNP